jgi:hypothetical protein
VEEDSGAAVTDTMSSAVYEVRGVGFLRIGLNVAATEVRSHQCAEVLCDDRSFTISLSCPLEPCQEVETACRMIYEFASALGDQFFPYVECTLSFAATFLFLSVIVLSATLYVGLFVRLFYLATRLRC